MFMSETQVSTFQGAFYFTQIHIPHTEISSYQK